MRKIMQISLAFIVALSLTALSSFAAVTDARSTDNTIKIDGSSTVFPISEAVAEEFQKTHPSDRVTVGVSGTGGGFKKFTVGETDISDASRPITDSERATAKQHGIDYIELPVAYDGIAVMVNPKNTFVDYLTVEELKRIWQPDSTVKSWSDVRSEWPAEKISLYGPSTDNGTFDYFTEEIVGKAKSARSDYSPSVTPNVLVQGIAGDPSALGFFGFAYYQENRDKLKLIPVKMGEGKAVSPSKKTIEDATYRPLSRPIFIYVNKNAAATRPEVREFVKYYLSHATAIVAQVGYFPFKNNVYSLALSRFQKKMTGTVFGTLAPEKRRNIAELLKLKGQ